MKKKQEFLYYSTFACDIHGRRANIRKCLENAGMKYEYMYKRTYG